MINISGIEAGYVIDHIASGKWRLVYDMLQLDKVEGQVAIITHANSSAPSINIFFNIFTNIMKNR